MIRRLRTAALLLTPFFLAVLVNEVRLRQLPYEGSLELPMVPAAPKVYYALDWEIEGGLPTSTPSGQPDATRAWLEAQGIPSKDIQRLSVLKHTNTVTLQMSPAHHARLAAALDRVYGPEHWDYGVERLWNLTFQSSSGKTVGVESHRMQNFDRATPGPEHMERHLKASFFQLPPLTKRFHYVHSSRWLNVDSNRLYYPGPAWPMVLIVTILPSILVYLLRRPIWRALTFWQHRTSNASET